MYQKTAIIGNVGKDPDIRYLDTGVCKASFSVATSESWKDKDGNRKQQTEWFNCIAWNKLGEIVEKYCKKGQQVFIECRKRERSYDKDGQTRYVTEFRVDTFKILGGKPKEEPAAEPQAQEPTVSNQVTGQQVINQPAPTPAPFDSTDGPDDLPF